MGASFVKRLNKWLDEEAIIREGLAHEGPDLMRILCGIHGKYTLRGVARETGLSPTYLSKVANSKVIISAGAYLKLVAFQKDNHWSETIAASKEFLG